MTPASLDGDPTCASRTCDKTATGIFAGVPLCNDHRRHMHAELKLPRAKFVPKDGQPWFVYYITWAHTPDVVKIGATHNPASRFSGLKKDGHHPKALVIEPGTDDLEALRHEQFADLCLSYRGEYYRYGPPLAEHIEALQREHPRWLSTIGRLPFWMDPAIRPGTFREIPRCGVPGTDDGGPCSAMAGGGTTHRGTGLCWFHERELRMAAKWCQQPMTTF